jgi:hypothetical protein
MKSARIEKEQADDLMAAATAKMKEADARIRQAVEEETAAKVAQQQAVKLQKEIALRNIQVDGRMALIKELIPQMKRVLEDLDHTELPSTVYFSCRPAPAGDEHTPPLCGTR